MIVFDVITIFPKQIQIFITEGVFRIAQEKGLVQINVHDLRKWSKDKHRRVDGRPFGGGAGMVLKVAPFYEAIQELRKDNTKVVMMSPSGRKLSQKVLRSLSEELQCLEGDNGDGVLSHMIILCGHYEGFDERIRKYLIDMEISVGDYILSGGELPALVLIDGLIRLLPGVLGNEMSNKDESFENDTLEYPHYTRPAEFNGWKVPDVLLGGDHKKIKQWCSKHRRKKTD